MSRRSPDVRAVSARRAWAVVLPLVAVLCLSEARAAHADDLPESYVACEAHGETVTCHIDVREMYTEEIYEEIESGFQNDLIWKVYLFPEDGEEPVALTIRRQLQIYDIWDEVHYVHDQFEDAPVEEYYSMSSVLDKIAQEDSVLVGRIDELESGNYFVAILIELNPLSDEEIAEIRSWISRNRGGHRTFSKGEKTFFGTLVSIFVNIRPGTAEAVLKIRSDSFYVP